MNSVLMLLDKNARMSCEDIAAATGKRPDAVKAELKAYEENGTIKGYSALIDWDKTDRNYVTAEIAVKILLNGKMGFDDIAAQLAGFEEVETVRLVSGAYDLSLTVSGKTFQEVAMFVASRLSPLEGVQSTSTSFRLKTYKERGVTFEQDADIREVGV